MKVAELRKSLEGVQDDLEVYVRATEESLDEGDLEIVASVTHAGVEESHHEEDPDAFLIDADGNPPHVRALVFRLIPGGKKG